MNIGYTKPLFILPFDHRSSFTKGLFGIEDRELSPEEVDRVKDTKQLVYDALKKAIAEGIPKEDTALLVDQQFGDAILRDAASQGITTIMTVEKSGQDEFMFEYGDDFGSHLLEYKPTFAKALIRYNPDNDHELNRRQRERLKQLSDFCHGNNMKLLIEPLIPATESQLSSVDGNQGRYDDEVRPDLTVRMISEIQQEGVEVDVWKIEGLNYARDYLKVAEQAHAGGRVTIGIVILGRAADKEQVNRWLMAGIGVPGVIGFAVGRTIFWEPLRKYKDNEITREQAVDEISNQYQEYCQMFLK